MAKQKNPNLISPKEIVIDFLKAAQGVQHDQAKALGKPSFNPPVTKGQDHYIQLLDNFATVISDNSVSPNPYNRPEIRHLMQTKYQVLEKRYFEADEIPFHENTFFELDAGRHSIGLDYERIIKFILILAAGGPYFQPIVALDRDLRIIDGINIVYACKVLGKEFKAIRLDYKHAASGLF